MKKGDKVTFYGDIGVVTEDDGEWAWFLLSESDGGSYELYTRKDNPNLALIEEATS